jgi:outer membrane protein
MKKLLLLLLIIILGTSCTQEKLAYVDIDEIYKEYTKAKKAEEEITTQSQQMSQQIDEMRIKFQQKVQEYQQNSSSLSDVEKQQKEQELMREQQEIQQNQQMLRQLIQDEGIKKMDKINEDIKSFISDYAKLKGFTLILGNSIQTKAVLYAREGMDITDDIIESLNEEYESEENESEENVEEESE